MDINRITTGLPGRNYSLDTAVVNDFFKLPSNLPKPQASLGSWTRDYIPSVRGSGCQRFLFFASFSTVTSQTNVFQILTLYKVQFSIHCRPAPAPSLPLPATWICHTNINKTGKFQEETILIFSKEMHYDNFCFILF